MSIANAKSPGKILTAVAFLVFLLAAHIALLCSPMTKEDTNAFLSLLAGVSLLISVFDLVAMKFLRLSLVGKKPAEKELLSKQQACGRFRFGTLFLLFAAIVASIVALTVSVEEHSHIGQP